jgi:glycosyltransferase 2 family protein
VAAVALLAVLVARAKQLIGTTELNVFDLFNSLPSGLVPEFRQLERLGTLWALGLVVAAALVGRRWRLARDLLLAGVLAWAVSRVLGSDVVGRIGLHASLHTLTHPGATPSFPEVRLALVAAVVSTAAPYLGRPARRLGEALVGLSFLGGMYIGTAYPDDLLGALAVGWAVAALVHLVFRSPGGRPSSAQIASTLGEIGISVSSIHLSSEQRPDATLFDCTDPTGRLLVKVIGRDELDAQLLAKAWRSLLYKDSLPALQLTRVQQVEHEACMTLLAGVAGVNVATVVFVGRAGPNAALLVLRPPTGFRLLAAIEAGAVTDVVLASIWQQVAILHQAGIAHGALDAAHVMCSETEAALVAFSTASTARPDHRQATDVAELLAATAGIVGDDRALAACFETLGETEVRTGLPFLQPPALGRRTRTALGTSARASRHRIEVLHRKAAERMGLDAPALPHLQRLRLSSLFLAAGGLVAVAVLLDQVGNPAKVWAIVGNTQWGWAAAALAVSLATNIAYAVALMGTLPIRLPLWPTSELQLAMSYSNLIIPVIGGTGFQIRFLQRQGAELPAAVAAGGLLSLVGVVVTEVPLFLLALWLSPQALHLGHIPVSGIIQTVSIVVVACGVIAAVAFGVPRLRRSVLPPVVDAINTIWTALRSPRQLALIVGGNTAVAVLYAFCLLACVGAFDATIDFWTAMAVSIGLGTIAALIPVPGGSAAFGAIGLSGVLVGLGIRTEAAVAITLANQLAVTYIPAFPGWVATRHLLHHSYL